jgi:Repeat of unknown function (DUF5907)
MATKTALISEIATNYADNTVGAITPAIQRATAIDGVNSWQQAPQVNQQSGTSYTVVVDDYGKMILLANASPVAITLPAATTTGFSPFNVLFKNNGAGAVTITPVTGTIDGAAFLALTSAQSAWIVSDGTNWRTGILAIAAGGGGSSGISGGTANGIALFGSPTTITSGVILAANQLIAGTAGAPAALTVAGDLTLSAGSFTIANSAVTYAKMQAVSAVAKLLGSSATTTAVQEITLGTNLSMSGTTLNATAGGGGAPTTSTYVTMSTDATLTAERVLTAGTGITLADGGANGNATLSLTAPVTAVLGGTGQTAYAIGDLLFANTVSTLSRLADVATGNALISGGVTTAPSWGKIGLTTHVTGILPSANGGTGVAFFQAAGLSASVKTFTFPNSSQAVACLDLVDQTVSGGANVTTLGLTTGNVTIDCGKCPIQSITNNGAYTITAPAADGSCLLIVTNGASAGATTFSGFSVGSNTGDALDTTNAHKFTVFIWRANGTSGYRIAAHQ